MNRFILNETSYHGSGAIAAIADEAIARGFKKGFVCLDPDLIKFGVTKKVLNVLGDAGLVYRFIPTLNRIRPSRTCRPVWRR